METADTHLHAELVQRADGPVIETLRWLGSMLGGLFQGEVPETVDLVVSRRDTEVEVLRLTLENTDEADFTLDAVNHDLGRMTVADFVREWAPRPES